MMKKVSLKGTAESKMETERARKIYRLVFAGALVVDLCVCLCVGGSQSEAAVVIVVVIVAEYPPHLQLAMHRTDGGTVMQGTSSPAAAGQTG